MDFKKYAYMLGLILSLPMTAWAYDSFDCIGSEPFWKLSLSAQKFSFTQQNGAISTLPVVTPQQAENMDIDHIRVFRTKMSNQEAIIIIQKQSCTDGSTDGSSDDMFAYEGLLISKDKVFHGCCSKKIVISK